MWKILIKWKMMLLNLIKLLRWILKVSLATNCFNFASNLYFKSSNPNYLKYNLFFIATLQARIPQSYRDFLLKYIKYIIFLIICTPKYTCEIHSTLGESYIFVCVCVCVYMFVCVGGGVVGCVCLGRGVGVVDWVCVFATQNSTEYYNIFISLV